MTAVGECTEYVCEQRGIPMDECRPRDPEIDSIIDEFYAMSHGINLTENSKATPAQQANSRKQAKKSSFGKFRYGNNKEC